MSKGQNTSSAVMQQRHAGRDEYDYYPTHPWATRALCEALERDFGYDLKEMDVIEPACGEGFMSRPLAEFFRSVYSSDIQDFTASFPEQNAVSDFLIPWMWGNQKGHVLVTNPPFVLAEEFIRRAFEVTTEIVCIFARSAFLEGGERYESLFAKNPPSAVYQFCERVAIHKGKITEKSSSATAYSWFIWAQAVEPRPVHWFPPGTKARLTKPDDYPDWAAEIAPAPLFDGAGL